MEYQLKGKEMNERLPLRKNLEGFPKVICHCSSCGATLEDDGKEPNTQPLVYCPSCYQELSQKILSDIVGLIDECNCDEEYKIKVNELKNKIEEYKWQTI